MALGTVKKFYSAMTVIAQDDHLKLGLRVPAGHTTRVIFMVKICIFERSNEKKNFSKTKIYFDKKTTS